MVQVSCTMASKVYVFCTSLPQLVHLYGVEKSLLPSRRLFGYLGPPKREQLVEMQSKFEVMLQTLLQKFQIPPKEMLKFVDYPFTVGDVSV